MENQNKDKWLLSFSGFLMLLFATFVVLYATLNIKNKELESQLEKQIQSQSVNLENEKLVIMQKQIQSDGAIATGSIDTVVTQRGLEIRFLVADFYSEKSFIPNDDIIPLIDVIGKKIKDMNLEFTVVGHADESEKNSETPSELDLWALTSQRAGWVVERWKRLYGFEQNKITVSARSYFEPRAQADKSKNWAQSHNRRVEIILRPQSTEEST